MTNREYLNARSDEEFGSVVLAKVADGTELDFEQWLKEEYKTNSVNDPKGADDELVLRDFMKKTERK